jgi:hypothetical protein
VVTTWTPPAGQTQRALTGDTGGGHVNTLVTDGATGVPPGTYGGYTATTDQSHSATVSWSIALNPAA